ncbi:hypothetical protein KKB99_02090, partial [bacterium]|nr:hypothetical protein [bacterium]MBU1024777.1 hypothetical protein [bacterium]
MDSNTKARYDQLKKNLKLYGQTAIAFSGGLSSAFLLRTAQNVLGTENVLAITSLSRAVPEQERLRSQALIKNWKINQVFVESEFWKDAQRHNSTRCKSCREDMYEKITKTAIARGYDLVLDGGTADDPICNADVNGTFAMLVKPLAQAGLTKEHLREISRFEGLLIYDIPENSCLISRFGHNREIKAVDLERVDRAETILRNLGFNQVRVRDHGEVARIEIEFEEWERFNDKKLRDLVYIGLKKLGYTHSTLDIKGYRPGSMDESDHSPS